MTKKEKGEKKKGSCLMIFLVSVLILLVLAIIIPFLVEQDDSKKEKKTQEQAEKVEVDANGWTEDDKIAFKTIVEMASDEYVDDYKSPWALDDWTFAKFDDTDKIIAITKYTLKEFSEKQPVICVFSWKSETEEYKTRFLSVGNKIFLDDGSCNEVFEKINELTNTESE